MLERDIFPKTDRLKRVEQLLDTVTESERRKNGALPRIIHSNLNQRGQNSVYSHGDEDLERWVKFTIPAQNVYRIGLLDIRHLREERHREEEKRKRKRLRAT